MSAEIRNRARVLAKIEFIPTKNPANSTDKRANEKSRGLREVFSRPSHLPHAHVHGERGGGKHNSFLHYTRHTCEQLKVVIVYVPSEFRTLQSTSRRPNRHNPGPPTKGSEIHPTQGNTQQSVK